MNRTKTLLLFTFFACAGLLGFGLYMQTVWDMLPCPLCVLQRYAFAFIGIGSLLALVAPKFLRGVAMSSLLFSLAGAGLATYQLWVISQPPGSCGADPLSGPLNSFFVAQLFPTMFKAIGLCETPYDPILGLSIPAWALVWFTLFGLVAVAILICNKKERVFFGKIRG